MAEQHLCILWEFILSNIIKQAFRIKCSIWRRMPESINIACWLLVLKNFSFFGSPVLRRYWHQESLGNLLQTSDTGLPLKPNLINVSLGLVRCISKQAPQVILTCTDGKINPTPLGIDARTADLSPLIGIWGICQSSCAYVHTFPQYFGFIWQNT